MIPESPSPDLLPPQSMAEKAVEIGIRKANGNALDLFILGVLAGAYIAFGAIFATVVTAGAKDLLAYGVIRLLAGLAFTLGLILVVVGGAELFTGNNLMLMAWARRQISSLSLLRNWGIVFIGNFVGSLAIAAIMFATSEYTFGTGAVGANILAIGEAKTNLGFVQAIMLGILCNMLVCLAVWLTYSGRTTTDKILSIIAPIACFVAAGFEHSVANMYFIPMALLVKNFAPAEFFLSIGKLPADYPNLTLQNFLLSNLLPVTIGNIIGGGVFIGLTYWFIYLRKKEG
jgi:formate transporter FocA